MRTAVPIIDFGLTARDFREHRVGFPDQFFNRLVAHGVGLPGQRIIDVGTGTGTIARGLAVRGSLVVGLDPSQPLLEEARGMAKDAGVQIHFLQGTVEDSGLPDGICEAIVAGQCWHWFDREKAASECRRLLVPAGKLVIAHFDWLPYKDSVACATEQLITQHNPDWNMNGSTGIYPEWLNDVGSAGFVSIETFSFDVDVEYSHEDWRGRMRASAGVGATMEANAIDSFDADLANLLANQFSQEPLMVAHRIWAVVCTSPRSK